MELQTISNVSVIGVIFSILISIGLPVTLMIVGKKKYGASISTFFIGAGTFFVFAMVLEQLIHIVVIKQFGLSVEKNRIIYYLYGALAAAVFEETGRIVAMKVLMKKRLCFEEAFMYGIGHGGVEAILIGGFLNLSNLVSMILVNSGQMETSLSALAPELREQTVTQLSALWTTAPNLFYASGIERLSAFILHIGLSLIVYKGLCSKKRSIVLLAYLIHFIVDFSIVLTTFGISIWPFEAIVFVLSAVTFIIAHRLNKTTEQQ